MYLLSYLIFGFILQCVVMYCEDGRLTIKTIIELLGFSVIWPVILFIWLYHVHGNKVVIQKKKKKAKTK